MSREPSYAIKCPHCGETFLQAQAACIGQLSPFWMEGRRPDQRITLTSCPVASRVEVMRLIRAHLPYSLSEAKSAVERLPLVLADAVFYWDAMAIQEALRKAGAVVDCEAIESLPAEEPPPEEWRAAPYALEPTELELIALAGRVESTPDERLVRLLAWREGNDPFRSTEVDWVPYSSRGVARESLEKLLTLLSVAQSDRMLVAEAMRQLGRFSECIELVSATDGTESPGSSTIRELAERRVDRLSVLFVAA
ncbi:MAG TPA: ribosomal protein L7/L12 [Labilithrix sp.]|nr:ribosomal protein L7/L12 [Labilithrix sp.]